MSQQTRCTLTISVSRAISGNKLHEDRTSIQFSTPERAAQCAAEIQRIARSIGTESQRKFLIECNTPATTAVERWCRAHGVRFVASSKTIPQSMPKSALGE